VFNTIQTILEGGSIIDNISMILPFYLFSILMIYNKTSKAVKSSIFFLIGVGYFIAIPDASYIGTSIFFTLAYAQYINIPYGLVLSFVTLILIVVKSTIVNHTPSQFIVSIIAFTMIYGNVYNEIEKYKKKINTLKLQHTKEVMQLNEQLEKSLSGELVLKRNIDVYVKNEEDKAILTLYCRGYDYDSISRYLALNIAPSTVRRKIKAVKDRNHYKITGSTDQEIIINDAQFGKWLHETV